MLTRFASWWVLAAATAGLLACAIISFSQTGDFLVFLGIGALVGLVANAKRGWINQGTVQSLLSYEFTARTFGPSENDPQKDGAA
jgi:hypothetical protein